MDEDTKNRTLKREWFTPRVMSLTNRTFLVSVTLSIITASNVPTLHIDVLLLYTHLIYKGQECTLITICKSFWEESPKLVESYVRSGPF